MGNEQMQFAIQQLQEAQTVLSNIDKMQTVTPELRQANVQSANLRVRIEKNLAEIREKLNRLIDPL
jgi:hypothetical protein